MTELTAGIVLTQDGPVLSMSLPVQTLLYEWVGRLQKEMLAPVEFEHVFIAFLIVTSAYSNSDDPGSPDEEEVYEQVKRNIPRAITIATEVEAEGGSIIESFRIRN